MADIERHDCNPPTLLVEERDIPLRGCKSEADVMIYVVELMGVRSFVGETSRSSRINRRDLGDESPPYRTGISIGSILSIVADCSNF